MQITITDQLKIAGIQAAATAYNNGQSEGFTPLTAEQYLQMVTDDAANSYVEQYKVGAISSGDFVLRFTAAEYAAINAAAETDPAIAGFIGRVRESAEVVLYSAEVQQGLAYLVSQSLLTQARADAIGAY